MKYLLIINLLIILIIFCITLYGIKNFKLLKKNIIMFIFIIILMVSGFYNIKNYDSNIKYISFKKAFINHLTLSCMHKGEQVLINNSKFLLVNNVFSSTGEKDSNFDVHLNECESIVDEEVARDKRWVEKS